MVNGGADGTRPKRIVVASQVFDDLDIAGYSELFLDVFLAAAGR